METVFLAIAIFAGCLLIMAVGVLCRRAPLKKQCDADPQRSCSCGADGDACGREGGLRQPEKGVS